MGIAEMRRWCGAAIALVVVTTLTTRAFAQGASREADAQQLFDEGRQLATEGKFAEACVKFATSDDLAPSGGAVLNLADCYERTGRTASAWVKFRATAERAEAAGRSDIAKMARDRADALAPRLPKLTVVVATEARIAGLDLRRDGEPLPAGEWGIELPVDPGKHEVDATAPGHERWSKTVAVNDGERVVVRVEPLPAEGGAPPPKPVDATPSSPLRPAGIAVAGAGVVGIGIGAVLGLAAIGKGHDVDAACPSGVCPDEPTRQHAREDNDSAKRSATGSTIAFGVGAVLVAAGVTMYLVAPHASSEASKNASGSATRWLRIGPAPARGGAGVMAEGAF